MNNGIESKVKLLAALAVTAVMLGCTTKDGKLTTIDGAGSDGAGTAIPDDSAGGAATYGAGAVGVAADGGPMQDSGTLLDDRTIFFELDSTQISSEGLEILKEHGQFLGRNPNSIVRIEGHADERGSREYNLGLGERRAQSVKSVLLVQGAAADQISVVSYGEERPAVFGSDESAWSKNRRAELRYGR